jgi:hypothetical protein
MKSELAKRVLTGLIDEQDARGLTQTFNVLVKHIGICSRDVLSYGPSIGVQIPFERNKS